jgi:hypothetical protein
MVWSNQHHHHHHHHRLSNSGCFFCIASSIHSYSSLPIPFSSAHTQAYERTQLCSPLPFFQSESKL